MNPRNCFAVLRLVFLVSVYSVCSVVALRAADFTNRNWGTILLITDAAGLTNTIVAPTNTTITILSGSIVVGGETVAVHSVTNGLAATNYVNTATGAKVTTNAAHVAVGINNGANLTNLNAAANWLISTNVAWCYAAAPTNSTQDLPGTNSYYLAYSATGNTQYVGAADIGGSGTNWIFHVLTAW